jgi:hypothetical protein
MIWACCKAAIKKEIMSQATQGVKEVVVRKEVVRTNTIIDHNSRDEPTNDCATYAIWETTLRVIADTSIIPMAIMRISRSNSPQKANFG